MVFLGFVGLLVFVMIAVISCCPRVGVRARVSALYGVLRIAGIACGVCAFGAAALNGVCVCVCVCV